MSITAVWVLLSIPLGKMILATDKTQHILDTFFPSILLMVNRRLRSKMCPLSMQKLAVQLDFVICWKD